MCSSTWLWLESEGYITKEGFGDSAWHIYGVQLTQKAMAALKAIPDPLKPDVEKRKLSDAISDACKSGGKTAASAVISSSIGAILNYTIS